MEPIIYSATKCFSGVDPTPEQKKKFTDYAYDVVNKAGMPTVLLLVAHVYIDRVDLRKIPGRSVREALYTVFAGALMLAGEVH